MALHCTSRPFGPGVDNESRSVFTQLRWAARGRSKRQQSYHRLRTPYQQHKDALKHQLTLWLAYIATSNRSPAIQSVSKLRRSRLHFSSRISPETALRQQTGSTTGRINTIQTSISQPTSIDVQRKTPAYDSIHIRMETSSIDAGKNRPNTPPSRLRTPPQLAGQNVSNISSDLLSNPNHSLESCSSSNLSSPPSSLGSTPEGLSESLQSKSSKNSRKGNSLRDSSPVRRSQRVRKPKSYYNVTQQESIAQPALKKRKLSQSSSSTTSSGSSYRPPVQRRQSIRNSQISEHTLSRTANSLPKSQQSSSLSNFSTEPEINAGRGFSTDSNPTEPSPPQNPLATITEVQYSLGESFERSKPLPKLHKAKTVKRHSRKSSDETELDVAQAFLAKVQGRQYTRETSDDQLDTYFFQREGFDAQKYNHARWKDKTMYPMFDHENPTYYGADGLAQYRGPVGVQHGSNHDSEAPSPPPRRGRGGGRGRGGFGGWRGRGRGRGGAGTGGGRDRGDSPDPPQKANLTTEDKLTLSHIRTRQAELKKFFALVGTQQAEVLTLLATRDLSKMVKKAKAHTKVPEFDEICDDIDVSKDAARELVLKQYEYEKQLAEQSYQREAEIVEQYFRTRVEEAQKEHVKGAEGDLIIFKNAHNAANDETRTEAGSDMECYFPRYHECPEPDATVRGYTSTKIKDEKSLKQHLATYDEQAQREVIDDDVFAPLAKSIAYQNSERKKAEDKEKTQTIDELVNVAEGELKEIGGHLIPRPNYPSENPQFALSRLADASEYVSRAHPEQSYIFMPVAPSDARQMAKDVVKHEPPSQLPLPPLPAPTARNNVQATKRATTKKQRLGSDPSKRPVRPVEQQNGTVPPTNLLPAIAPAPVRLPPPPPSPIYAPPPSSQHMSYTIPLPVPQMMPTSPQSHSRRSSQSFTFTPTQTPGHSYFAPNAAPRPYTNGTTGQKMHNTFVNQTVESRLQADIARENAARTQGQGAGPKGGKRILLPKV